MRGISVFALLSVALAARRSHNPVSLNSYSFDQFIQDFGRSYKHGTSEYEHRLSLFQSALQRIHAVNTKNHKEARSWSSGIHPFMDWSESERKVLNGYKPSRNRLHRMTALQSQHSTHLRATTQTWNKTASTSSMPEQYSWDGIVLPIVNQGSCGSCWAISAVEALEAQLQKTGQGRFKVSAQALVDCVPNPQHCGGTGGCDGATGELAYAWVKDHGVPMESELVTLLRQDIASIARDHGPLPSVSAFRAGISSQVTNTHLSYRHSTTKVQWLCQLMETTGLITRVVFLMAVTKTQFLATRFSSKGTVLMLVSHIGRSKTHGVLTGARTVSFA
jgi:hypothetical protein